MIAPEPKDDYAHHYLRAKQYLDKAYNAAAAGRMGEAITISWDAETHAKKFALALESERVRQARSKER